MNVIDLLVLEMLLNISYTFGILSTILKRRKINFISQIPRMQFDTWNFISEIVCFSCRKWPSEENSFECKNLHKKPTWESLTFEIDANFQKLWVFKWYRYISKHFQCFKNLKLLSITTVLRLIFFLFWGFNNPWSITCTDNGTTEALKTMFVLCFLLIKN